jgi:hypothetical protein
VNDGLREILTWSLDIPQWQQDALRRLIEKGNLDGDDLAELKCMAKVAHGMGADLPETPTPKSFYSSRPGSAGKGRSGVHLLSVSDIEHVNALDSARSGVVFSPVGLTVVYGNNGSGKSGYTRILRQMCRVRGDKQDILPDVFGVVGQGTPKATVTYKCGDTEKTHCWEQGGAVPPELLQVGVFDTLSAEQLVTGENEIAFRPFGLDILDKLGNAFGRLKSLFEADRNALQQPIDLDVLTGATAVGKLINGLDGTTEDEDIKTLATMAEEERKRLVWLRTNLPRLQAEDPAKLARQCSALCAKVEALGKRLDAYTTTFSDENLERVRELQGSYIQAKQAVKVATSELFAAMPLDGVGSDLWLALWRAAGEFSEGAAYPGRQFPVTEHEARCVLCQQPLGEKVAERFEGFKAHVAGALQKQAGTARQTFAKAGKDLVDYRFEDGLDSASVQEVKEEDGGLASLVDDRLAKLAQRQQQLKKVLNRKAEWDSLGALPVDCSKDVKSLVAALADRASKYEEAADPEKLSAMVKELAELEARVKLHQAQGLVLREIGRLRDLKKLDRCVSETRTNGVTALSNTLTDSLVTQVLCDAFEAELRRLRLGSTTVQLRRTRSSRGVSYHRIVFPANDSAKLGDVLSEGEFRCIALAGFLTELASSTTASAIVFDDPVSSLDHLWRDRTAGRLADEAKVRQVIVFTHDLVFLKMLHEHATREDAELGELHLTRTGISAGICLDGPPWYGMKVKDRVKVLNARCQDLAAFRKTATDEDYLPKARRMYGLLRETWELAVEEVVLNGVVVRFGRGVSTKPLQKLTDITVDDYRAVELGMDRTSAVLTGHDKAGAINDAIPEPAEIQADIKALADLVKVIRGRR